MLGAMTVMYAKYMIITLITQEHNELSEYMTVRLVFFILVDHIIIIWSFITLARVIYYFWAG